ncbi:MAG: hypothetical protein JSS81_25360 [Acidobacteria bacterium]|nr:hypothetical protein [Acidobacteriota bacterium]
MFFYAVAHRNGLECISNRKECKIVSPARKAIVKIDGNESAGSTVFEDARYVYLVSDVYRKGDFALMTIDKSRRAVTFPDGNYDILFSNYLILPYGGGGIFFSDGVKAGGFDEQLRTNDSGLDFVVPEWQTFKIPEHRVEIIFTGERCVNY